MIVTIYKPDGEKERKAIGYGGDLCHQATAPYERREGGSLTKTATPEALSSPTVTQATQVNTSSK